MFWTRCDWIRTCLDSLRVDGGAARNDSLLQFQADLLGVPVVRPAITESTAMGAALLAGLGVGVWNDPAHAHATQRIDRTFEPAMAAKTREDRYAAWLDAVRRVRTTA
jgi:glycerol kinase